MVSPVLWLRENQSSEDEKHNLLAHFVMVSQGYIQRLVDQA